MNTKKILCIVTLLLVVIITACEAGQPGEMISSDAPEEQEEAALPEVTQEETKGQEGPSLFSDTEPPPGSQTLITRENAHQLTQIQYLGKGNINDIAWSSSGSPIALATVTGIYLIDPLTKEEIHFTKTPSNRIDFLPGGSVLASVEESQVIFRDLINQGESLILGGQIENTAEIAFSSSGDLVAIASTDGTVIIKDLVSEEVISTINKPGTFFYHLAFSQDGKILVSNAYLQESDHSDVLIWDVESGEEIVTASEIRGSNSAVSPQSELIAAGGYDDPLRLLDFNGQVQKILDEEPKPVFGLAFSPDGKILGSITLNNTEESWTSTTIKLWDTASGELLHRLDDEGEYHHISFSPDNKQVVAASVDQAKLWDVESGQEIGVITDQTNATVKEGYGNGWFADFAWSPNGNTLALVNLAGVTLIDINTNEEIDLSIYGTPSYNGHIINFSPDGDLLAIASHKAGHGVVEIFNIESHERIYSLEDFEDMGAFGLAFSPDNTRFATGWGNPWGAPGGVKIWDTLTGTLIYESNHEFGIGTVFDLTFNKEGNLLAGIDGNGRVYIWDSDTFGVVQHFQATDGYGYAVAFSPDSKLLGVGGAATFDDATACLRLFNLETEEILFDLQGHQDWYIGRVSFNADGGVFASASEDGTVRLWDTQTGEQLALLDVPGATSVSFSPDGSLLATAGYADVLRLWGLPESTTINQETSPSTSSQDLISFDNVEQLTPLSIIDDDSPKHLAGFEFSDNGELIIPLDHQEYGNLEAYEVVLWEIASGKEKSRMTLELGSLTAAAFHPSQNQIALGGTNSTVYLWDFDSGETILITEGIPWSHDGSMTLANGSNVEMVPVTSLDFSPDGAVLAVAYSEGWGHSTVELYDMTKAGEPGMNTPYWTDTFERPGDLSLAFHPDEMILLGSYHNVIYLWDALTGKLLDRHFLNNEDPFKTDLSYAQEGKILVTTTKNQTNFWDMETFEAMDMLNHLDGLKAINLNASIMAVAGENEIGLWDMTTKTQLRRLQTKGKVVDIAFSPNDTLLALAYPDGTIHLWGIPKQ